MRTCRMMGALALEVRTVLERHDLDAIAFTLSGVEDARVQLDECIDRLREQREELAHHERLLRGGLSHASKR